MFPDPCGEEFERAVVAGIDPLVVVPDDYYLLRGGSSPLPQMGAPFSGCVGPTIASAAAALPHGTVRIARVGDIRRVGAMSNGTPK